MTISMNHLTVMAMDRSPESIIREITVNDLSALGNKCDVLSILVKELNYSVCSVVNSLNSEIKDLTEIRGILPFSGSPLQCNSKGTQTEENVTLENKTTSEPQFDKGTKIDVCVLCDSFQMLEHCVAVYDESSGKSGLERKINSSVPLRTKSSNKVPQQICDSCFKKFTLFYQNCANSNKKQQEVIRSKSGSKAKRSSTREDTKTDLQDLNHDTTNVQYTPPSPEENGMIQDLTPLKEIPVPPVVRKRGRPRKCLEETPDLSKLDPEHGSGLQVEWLLVNSNPPPQKYTCKRTRTEKSTNRKETVDQSKSIESDSDKTERQVNISQKHDNMYTCAHCPELFASKSEAFLHKLTKHSKDIPGIFIQNDKKTKTISSAQDFQENIPATTSVETSTEKLICDLCNRHFKSDYSLFIHKTEVHSPVKNLLAQNVVPSQGLLTDKNVNNVSPSSKLMTKSLVNQASNISLKTEGKSDSVGPKNCPFCSIILPNQFYIDKHCEEVHGRYMCTMCEGVFYDKEEHTEHMASHETWPLKLDSQPKDSRKNTVDIIYECKHCTEKFPNQSLLLSHQEKPCNQSELKCDTCGESFQDKALLDNHMSVHIGCDFPFECAKCDRKFPNNDSLKRHQLDHLGDKFMCTTCGDVFLTAKGLEMHTQETHKNRLPYLCRVCGKRYPNEVSLKAHRSIHKKKRGQHVCNVCGKDFFLARNLERHKVAHPGKQIYKCLLCFKAFKELATLLKHKAVHQFDKSFICMLCMSYFSCLSALQKHRLEDHTYQEILEARQKRENISFQMGVKTTEHQCEVCDEVFRTKLNLHRHMLLHNSDKQFKCSHCPREYASQMHLNQHMRYHTGEAPFLCNVCGKSFQGSKLLAQHMVIHTNEHKFSCHYCDKTFRWHQSLENHIQSHGIQKSFHCPTCNRPYQHKNSMLKHFKSKVCQPGEWVDSQLSNGISGECSTNNEESLDNQVNNSDNLVDSNILVTNDIGEEVEYDVVMDENFIPE